MPSRRIWIMDGHNIIFAVPTLQRLQLSDHREEARAGLAERLERFAIARGERVLVVFDGKGMHANPDAARRPLLETIYSRQGEGAADDRIISAARECQERGFPVTVVTDDVHTLASRLPRGVQHLGVAEFWSKHIDPESAGSGSHQGGSGARQDDKRVVGDFSDVEREMLARAAAAEPTPSPRRAASDGPRAPAARRAPLAPGIDTAREHIRRKRERGRRRQERRLESAAKSGRRR